MTEELDELCTAHMTSHHQAVCSCTGMCGSVGQAFCKTAPRPWCCLCLQGVTEELDVLRLQRDSLDDQVQRIEWALQEEAAQGDSGAAGTTQQWETVTRLNQERNAVSPAALRHARQKASGA